MYDSSDWRIIGSDKVKAIGLGTYGIKNYDKAFEAVVYAVDHGINLIDTAEMYDGGRAEEFVGRVIREVGRDSVFITTKLMPRWLPDKELVIQAAEKSLRRLGISFADLMLIHWPHDILPISVQVKNFEILAEKGLTRYIGVSNFDIRQLREAMDATSKHPIVVNQVHYSVANRHYVEKELLPFCIAQRIVLQAYTPLERGSVADNPVLKKIASKLGKTPVQVALNYLISHANVVAIPKTESLEHAKEILGSMGWRLDPSDLDHIKKHA